MFPGVFCARRVGITVLNPTLRSEYGHIPQRQAPCFETNRRGSSFPCDPDSHVPAVYGDQLH